MSSGRDGSGFSQEGRRGLVLVRGGLDDARSGGGSADWQAFCQQIGWQPGESALADDFEQRLAERIFGRQQTERSEALLGKRSARPVEVEADWPHAEATAGRNSIVRRRVSERFAGAAAMAVAAVMLIVAAAMLSWAEQRAARTLPQPTREDAAPVTDSPPALKLDADDVLVDDGSAKPAPSETAPLAPDPGSLALKHAERRRVGPRISRARVARRPDGRDAAMGAKLERSEQEPRSEQHPRTGNGAMDDAAEFSTPPAESVAFTAPALATPAAWHEPATSTGAMQPADAGRSEPVNASWSVSPAKDRWYGVALPPSGEPGRFAAGVGVMAQVDIGRAFAGL